MDIGCGSGYGTNILAGRAERVLGCDFSLDAAYYAAAKSSQTHFVVASATALPVPTHSVGLVTAFEVIEHSRDWRCVIAEAARVLALDGVFVVSTCNPTYYAENREGVGFTLDEFQRGLEIVFPFVRILGQNHQQAVIFRAEQTPLNGSAFVPPPTDLQNAHFFVAVCSNLPVAIPSFAYIPESAHLLREREHYIHLLRSEGSEAGADLANLLAAQKRLNHELESRVQTRDLSAAYKAAKLEADKLRSELEHVRRSSWLRLGKLLDIGPWTESRLHMRRLGRWIYATPVMKFWLLAQRFLMDAAGAFFACMLLLITAVVFAVEDVCFSWFGKRQLPQTTGVEHKCASVVIANWNGRHLLASYLPSVIEALSNDGNNEIIVVDNASSDGSSEFVRAWFPSVRVIDMDRNLGFGAASVEGVKAASNDVVVLLNNDMRVEPDFLAPLLEPFADDKVFAVSSQIFFADPDKRREETGLTEVWWEGGRVRASHRIDPEITVPYPCAYPGGGSSAFDRKKFIELGGFDPLFEPFYYEDTDIGFRAWKRGWKVYYQPASVVHHCHRATIRKNFPDSFIQATVTRNSMLYCWKNIHDWKMLSSHLAMAFWDCSKFTRPLSGRYGSQDVIRAFEQIRSAVKSRWYALSQSEISDQVAFLQPLGGYFRDTFIAGHKPAPERLQVLFVSPFPIEPPMHGGGVFMRQAVTQLAAYADVHLVSFVDTEQQLTDQQPLREVCKSASFQIRGGIQPLSWTLTPLPVRQFASRDFSWLIHRTMLLHNIDVVQIEYTMLGQYAGKYSHIPCLLFEHDVFSQTLWRGLKRSNLTAELLLEYIRMRLYEPRLLRQVTRIQVCSGSNATYIKRLAPAINKVDIDMRAAINTASYLEGARERDFNTLLFVGGFNHAPNVQGLRWFISQVFDLILAVRPNVVLELVGSYPPPPPNCWDGHPNIRMMGQVPDVRTPLRRAGIFICPILTGSGIRVKLLEAFASEIAVVSTTLGAEGLASESGLVCELADTPEAFAKSILVLLENKHYRDELVERARLMVTKERDSHSAIARLERSYRGEVSQVRPPARDKPLQLS